MNYGTPEEWVKWYEKKTGDTFTVPDGYTINYHERRGLMTFKPVPENKMLVIGYVIGDGHFWYDVIEMIAKMNGYRYIAAICTRDVMAYIRFWRYKIVKKWDKDGQKRFLGKDRAGRYGTMTYRGKDEKTGVDQYMVIRYMVPGEKPKLEE